MPTPWDLPCGPAATASPMAETACDARKRDARRVRGGKRSRTGQTEPQQPPVSGRHSDAGARTSAVGGPRRSPLPCRVTPLGRGRSPSGSLAVGTQGSTSARGGPPLLAPGAAAQAQGGSSPRRALFQQEQQCMPLVWPGEDRRAEVAATAGLLAASGATATHQISAGRSDEVAELAELVRTLDIEVSKAPRHEGFFAT
jgi:hypothetical protein